MAPVVGRRALVVMTDGMDEGSRTDLAHVIREAQLDDVAVYSVMFTNEDPGIRMRRGFEFRASM